MSHMDYPVEKASEPPSKQFKYLLAACRIGDLDTVDSLTSNHALDINQVDEWDYLPLILASLCGHKEVVEFLLTRGAVCDRDTFQGARCIYGALTDEIRTLLTSYDITKKVDVNQPFSAHITRLRGSILAPLLSKDIAIVFGDEVFLLSRFYLVARCEYFARKLAPGGAWELRASVEMPEASRAAAFSDIIDFLYLRADLLPLEKPSEKFAEFAKKLRLTELQEGLKEFSEQGNISAKEISRLKQKTAFKFDDGARDDMKAFLYTHILGNRLEIPLEEEINFEDIDAAALLSPENHQKLADCLAIPDIIMSSIDVDSGCVYYYPVHREILARSEYFLTMFRSAMYRKSTLVPLINVSNNAERFIDRPSVTAEHVPVLQASLSTTSAEATEAILLFLYFDDITSIRSDLAAEVLAAAEELLTERLKTMAALAITDLVNDFLYESMQSLPSKTGLDVYELVELAWLTRCDRLEQHMTKLVAHNLGRISRSKHARARLLRLIEQSAHRIHQRQDTDTIELVDDMRYYLGKKYHVSDDFAALEGVGKSLNPAGAEAEDLAAYVRAVEEMDEDIALIEGMLEEVELEA